MSSVKRCDRCGKDIAWQDDHRVEVDQNFPLDLCGRCHKALKRWMEEAK